MKRKIEVISVMTIGLIVGLSASSRVVANDGVPYPAFYYNGFQASETSFPHSTSKEMYPPTLSVKNRVESENPASSKKIVYGCRAEIYKKKDQYYSGPIEPSLPKENSACSVGPFTACRGEDCDLVWVYACSFQLEDVCFLDIEDCGGAQCRYRYMFCFR